MVKIHWLPLASISLSAMAFYVTLAIQFAGCFHKEPTQVLPAPGEHSVLVNHSHGGHK